METQKQSTPAPQKSKLPYFIGVGLVILLAGATFVAGRYLNRGDGNLSVNPMGVSGPSLSIGGAGEAAQSFELDIEPAEELPEAESQTKEELPKTEPQTMGIFVERADNTIIVSPANSVYFEAPDPNYKGTLVLQADYVGDKVEVVISNDTTIYQDVTPMTWTNTDENFQLVLELSTIDAIFPQSAVTVWGRKTGDRILADVILFLSPFASQKGVP